MNGVIRTVFRPSNLRALLNPVSKIVPANVGNQRQLARNLWYMSKTRNEDQFKHLKIEKSSVLCSCGCGISGIHTKGERELVEFLTEEILNERKTQKGKAIPSEIDGYKVKLQESEIILTKNTDKEIINIQFSVNHTVDTENEDEANPNAEKPDVSELKSKPNFRVELTRKKTTLSLLCSFVGEHERDDEYNDLFGIDEISIFENEWNDKVYAVSGDVIDSYLYDLMMNYLEEKGINNDFVEKIIDLSTAYEHASYVGLLESLSKFASGK